MNRSLFAIAVAGLTLTACGDLNSASAPSRQEGALTTTNGRDMNGRDMNGRGMNGRDMNGRGMNGVDLGTMISVDTSPVIFSSGTMPISFDTHLEGSTLTGHRGFTAISGADYVGAHFIANLVGGSTATLRITDHKYDAAPNDDLDLYMVEQQVTDDDGTHWEALCADEDGNAAYASAVSGYWDYSQGTATGGSKTESSNRFTFTCPGGAIYKCVEWGYRPWESVNGQSVAPYHQACTRLVRADYCGDGISHTIDGSWINLYDNLGVQTDTESWVFEAQWSPDGATCIAPGGVRDDGAGVSCYANLVSSSCSADAPDALLSTETPHGVREP